MSPDTVLIVRARHRLACRQPRTTMPRPTHRVARGSRRVSRARQRGLRRERLCVWRCSTKPVNRITLPQREAQDTSPRSPPCTTKAVDVQDCDARNGGTYVRLTYHPASCGISPVHIRESPLDISHIGQVSSLVAKTSGWGLLLRPRCFCPFAAETTFSSSLGGQVVYCSCIYLHSTIYLL